MNLYEQIAIWLSDYEPIGQWLNFNVIDMTTENSYSMQSVPGSTVTQEFNNGNTERDLIFSIVLVKEYDTSYPGNNFDAIGEVDNLREWIENSSTLPDFGENIVVNQVDILDDVPSITIDQNERLCHYIFQSKINYLKLSL